MRMMNRRQFLKSAGAGLLAAGSLDRLARLASAQQETIPIGVVYPLTGSLARIGASIKNAIELATDIVNTPSDLDLPLARDAGLPRLRGARLRLVWADSKAIRPPAGRRPSA